MAFTERSDRNGGEAMSTPRRPLEVETIGDFTVVRFADRTILDEHRQQVIRDNLFGLVEQLHGRGLLLDFGAVEYLSSPFLGTVITLNKRLRDAGRRLILCNIAPQIREVLEKLGMGGTDPGEGLGGVLSRLNPPKPSGGESAALRPPPPESE